MREGARAVDSLDFLNRAGPLSTGIGEIDDLSFTVTQEVPAPASLALLGAGLLGLGWARRRHAAG